MKYFEKHIKEIVDILVTNDNCYYTRFWLDLCRECNIGICNHDKVDLIKSLLSEVPEPVRVSEKEMLELKHMLINRGMFSIHCDKDGQWMVENNNECEQLANDYAGLDATKMYELKSLVWNAEVIEDGTVC